ncbi:aspartate dehydrogenase [Bradyrhizobium canariense]|uniref:aspartate dehydrogenase n=1 Tax=Bradyrhizobium canariense TaxID=255045 RepID=UPI001FCCCEF3|nr:aspartate dehydrogenase [Bradyrhizobium canariense]
MRSPLRLAFIGWGAINARVGEILTGRQTPVKIVGIAIRTPEARAMPPFGASFLSSPEELIALKPDLVIEAAGRAAIAQWAPAALAAAPAAIFASTSAFADDGMLVWLTELVERHQSKIEVPSGAIGGIDALASTAVLGLDDVLHQIVKPPRAWKATLAEQVLDLDGLANATVSFSGSAREAAACYPQNANATVVTSLAGIGLDRTRVEMVADPAADMNGHRITAHGAFGQMEIALQNRPLATNPKSS